MGSTLRNLLGAAVYLGVGALVVAWKIGPTFEPQLMMFWFLLLAWPVYLFLQALKWIAILFVGSMILLAIYVACYHLIPPFRRWLDRLS